jgi:hypothetical protein
MGYWTWGMKRKLAAESKLPEMDLYVILNRQVRCAPEKAVALAIACKQLGLDISYNDWLWNRETKNKAFNRRPVQAYPPGYRELFDSMEEI